MCVCVLICLSVCVCLTIFVSILSAGTDASPQHLDVFAAGAAVELVDPVVPPAHSVSHPGLVLHVHAEVNPIHAKHLLHTRDTRVTISILVLHALSYPHSLHPWGKDTRTR